MDENIFSVFRVQSKHRGETEFPSNDGRFYVCVKITGTDRIKAAALDFGQSKHFSWDDIDSGYVASFKRSFFPRRIWCMLKSRNIFKGKDSLNFDINVEFLFELTQIFEKMHEALHSQYIYKYDLLRNYMFEIFHLTIKMRSEKATT